MKIQISDQSTVFDITKKFRRSPVFFERFHTAYKDVGFYTLGELAHLHEIEPRFMLFLIDLFEMHSVKKVEYLPEFISLREVLNYLYITHNDYRSRRLLKIERLIFNLLKLSEMEGRMLAHTLCSFYSNFKRGLLHHLDEEEKNIFPLAKLKLLGIEFDQTLLWKYQEHHEDETKHDLFSVFSLIPPYALNICTSYHWLELETELKKFKKDLAVHAWVEDHLLLPMLVDGKV